MKHKLFQILLVNSLADLFKHKSFFLLIFILAFADRGLSILKGRYHITPGLPVLHQLKLESLGYVFDRLPGVVLHAATDLRVIGILIGLFFLKQIISLWPSSDMRRMHRRERGNFGILTSLTAIGWQQVAWDAIALIFLCSLAGIWCLGWFFLHRLLWRIHPSLVLGVTLAVAVSVIFPLVLAGFSFSSKLAVISKGSFGEKLGLFSKLFTSSRIARWSWLFYAVRTMLEGVFVVAIPTLILLTVHNYILRIMLAAILATPVYSYLKMASFKFFLIVYETYPLVRQEYHRYYQSLAEKGGV